MWRTVKNYKNEYAAFSPKSNKFLTPFMSKEEYIAWRNKKCGITFDLPLDDNAILSVDYAIYKMSETASGLELIKIMREAKLIV